MADRLLTYAAALLVGVAAMLLVMPVAALVGGGAGWNPPGPDQAQALAGHLAFQADGWRWPLLSTERLFWPRGLTVAMTDSNPLVSLLAKAWVRGTGAAPGNWLAGFMGVCWLMQSVAGAYAARGLRVSGVAAVAAGVMAAAWPALMFRVMHINLCAHFLVLLALGLAFRRVRQPGGWWAPGVLLCAAILVHPYLFQLCAVVLAVVPLDAVLRRRAGWWREWAGFLGCGVGAVGLLVLLSGPLGGNDKGFVFFSMNLVSPVWPQRSGVFGAGLPIVDVTGGQYEGFNWLGAGTLLLLLALGVQAGVRRAWPRPGLALVLVLGGLAVLSLSSRVYAGPVKVLDLGTKPWEDLFGSFRAPGRAFWPVGYALMLAGVAAADRLPRRVGVPVLLAAVALQVVDIRPLLAETRASWTEGAGVAVPRLPAGTALFGVAPYPGCDHASATKVLGPMLMLAAVRQGAMLSTIGMGRSPPWFSCEAVVSDALELPLLPHEVRAFFEPNLGRPLRVALLGPGAACRRADGVVLCARDAPDLVGEAVAEGLGAGVLGFGWVAGDGGESWSEGPRATLTLPAGVRRVRLAVVAVGDAAGRARRVSVAVGRGAPLGFELPDGEAAEIAVPVTGDGPGDGPGRVAITIVRPVDPARRGLVAPVRRAALRLRGVVLEDGEGRVVR